MFITINFIKNMNIIDMENIKKIDIKEFREKGYLQELNRRFLHPLGLALEVDVDKLTGEESLGGIWDCREDKEGVYYGVSTSDKERKDRMVTKKEFIDNELATRTNPRKEILGFDIEPLD